MALFQIFRNNPGLGISLALLCAGALVCLALGFLMSRSGVSLRPIYWFAGLFSLIVVPQFLGHLYRALHTSDSKLPISAAPDQLSQSASPAFTESATRLFGPDADPQLIIDCRNAFGDVFANATFARFATLPSGESILLAQFNGYLAAEKAWVDYLRVSGLNRLDGKGDSQRGYVVTRPTGDRAYVLHMQNRVGVWTGPNDAAIRRRMITTGFEIPRRAPLGDAAPVSRSDSTRTEPTASTKPLATGWIAAGIALYAVVVVAYFFKGAAWAGTYPAKSGSAPIKANELAQRLEAINTLDVPFVLQRGNQPNVLFATWRFADAKWIDLARARGMKRTLQIRLVLDERTATLRATDYWASLDWSTGRGGAAGQWNAAVGILFYFTEHQRVFGLQLDDQGNFKPDLTYPYTFNLNEMKSPLIDAVTRSGWNWRPTLWEGPSWLRWLTE